MGGIGKIFILWGLIFILVGLLLTVMPNIPWIGKLPGDIVIRKNNVTFYFPLASCIIISIILTLIFNLFRR